MKMFYPTWLPPLNAHENYTIRVSAHQAPPSLSSPPPLPGYLSIEAKVGVVFFAGLCVDRTLRGLSLSKSFAIHPDRIKTFNLVSELQIQFPLDNFILWESQAIGGPRSAWQMDGEGELEGALKDFLCGSAIGPCGAVRLRVEKTVQVPVSEFREWCRWYDHNAKAGEGFERDYAKAISRPRSGVELVEEVLVGFRLLPVGSVRGFPDGEEVEIDYEEDDQEGDSDETVVMEEATDGNYGTQLRFLHFSMALGATNNRISEVITSFSM
ncbi:hypothetical protein RHGRI_002130 [Rhododendron griersonianum]|uniref:Uncharacterized protein n=1 Tax=Rhododendron griersonianum TaxID=479676 RepID=A0AAV6LMP8_9ERIC|nr:hypothetical protein RHGRI_002130 [Rhododendron griersonianum]